MNLDFHTVGANKIVRHFYQKNYSIVLAIKLLNLMECILHIAQYFYFEPL